jgi:hypothetical protein
MLKRGVIISRLRYGAQSPHMIRKHITFDLASGKGGSIYS